MRCTEGIHEGTASVTLDPWQGVWSLLPNEFVESALRASAGLQIQHFILKQHHLTQLPANFSAVNTGLPNSLRTLDLSHNCFSSLPLPVCDLKELKELHLNHNTISHLPEQFSNLTKLETLYLQANKLQALPVVVCGLASLRSLNAEDNEIEVVPSEVCQLQQLRTLYLKCNRLHKLRLKIAGLPNLEELHLSNNSLRHVELGGLQGLRQLHLANNNLRALPFSIVDMDLQGLTVSNNPLRFPPMSVCRQGLGHIKSYMVEKFNSAKPSKCDPVTYVVENPYYDSRSDGTDSEEN